ncbi:hypothetical protein [Candidatus Nitrososphaera evergladensis]|uniref:hypothetical protein n=1 Tax=Candidatus Nitrososphaera evergladensis TaxID=1459637 RepID=UPI0011E5A27F|nr:hypothetical protein [Candidatus Nitrososphaera evergladensis]
MLLFSNPPTPIATIAPLFNGKRKRQAKGINAVIFDALNRAGPGAYRALYNDARQAFFFLSFSPFAKV